MKLVWVAGHQVIKVNEKADEFVVRELSLVEATACNNVLTPLVVVANKIVDCHLLKLQPRTMWTLSLRKRTQTLLSLDRVLIRFLVGVITGHCMI